MRIDFKNIPLSMIIIVGVLTEMQKNEKSKYCF